MGCAWSEAVTLIGTWVEDGVQAKIFMVGRSCTSIIAVKTTCRAENFTNVQLVKDGRLACRIQPQHNHPAVQAGKGIPGRQRHGFWVCGLRGS